MALPQGLSRHLYPELNYSAMHAVQITGQFDPTPDNVANQSFWRGMGWSVVRTGVGAFTITLTEALRQLQYVHVEIIDPDTPQQAPYDILFTGGPGPTGTVFTLQAWFESLTTGIATPADLPNTSHLVSFMIVSEESTGRLR